MSAKTSSNLYSMVESQGGKVLSEYVNNRTKIKIECNCGFIWEPSAGNIKRGSWCPKCSKVARPTIEDCQSLANNKNGKCLDETYVNARFLMSWMCSKGHIWKSNWNNIKSKGSWCPGCEQETKDKFFLKKYGCKNPMQNKEVYAKARATTIQRYGVPYALQNTEIALKNAVARTNSSIESHWETGEELICVASYEQKVVKYLNNNKIRYLWQPETFSLPNGRTYRPDLYLVEQDLWVEIKGYFTDLAKEKWELFIKIKPNACLWFKKDLKEMGIL